MKLSLLALLAATATAAALGPGSIAIIGYNSDDSVPRRLLMQL